MKFNLVGSVGDQTVSKERVEFQELKAEVNAFLDELTIADILEETPIIIKVVPPSEE